MEKSVYVYIVELKNEEFFDNYVKTLNIKSIIYYKMNRPGIEPGSLAWKPATPCNMLNDFTVNY